MRTIFFDESLGALVDSVVESLGAGALANGVVLRDGTGLLCFACAASAPDDARRAEVERALKDNLSSYARPDRVLLFAGDPGAQGILTDPNTLIVEVSGRYCKVLDRRIIGSGWLVTPYIARQGPPRVAFASLKGGVGRSTAITVAAADLAARGRNVLMIDLDLEAPSVGEMILTRDQTPRFGVLDYLVENGIGGIQESLLGEFVGATAYTTGGGGRVDIVPAIGRQSIEASQNILPKLARAMLEDVSDTGITKSAGAQISEMIDRLSTREAYDVVLIDNRAGLAELAAPAVLGLGAQVLLFGTAQQQTITGYRALFSGLKLLATRDLARDETADWRLMFKPVYAKASLNHDVIASYAAELYELFAENLYDADDNGDSPESTINFSVDDPDAPHSPLIIPFDPRFVDFDPSSTRHLLSSEFYEQTFRPFLNGLDRIIVEWPGTTDRLAR